MKNPKFSNEKEAIRIKGLVKIQIIEKDKKTNEEKIVDERIQHNIVCDETYLQLLNRTTVSNELGDKNVFISNETGTPVAVPPAPLYIQGIGSDPVGITTPTFNETGAFPYGEVTQDIAETGVSRDFYTIGLTSLASNNDFENTAAVSAIYSYLLLDDAPCTQGPAQVVRITYQVQFLFDTVPRWRAVAFGRALFGLANTALNTAIQTASFVGNGFVGEYEYLSTSVNDNAIWGTNPSRTFDNTHFTTEYTQQYLYNVSTEDGIILNFLGFGETTPDVDGNESEVLWGSGIYNENPNSPFQPGFFHNTQGTLQPFFDVTFQGNSEGDIVFGGTWENNLPFIVRLEFGTGGEVGTATYKFSVKYTTGFQPGSWVGRRIFTPYLNGIYQAHPNMHGHNVDDATKIRLYSYSDLSFVYYSRTEVTLLSLFTGQCREWTATEGLLATDIQYIVVAGSPGSESIFVGCSNTGVWQIDVVGATVTQRVNAFCYGLCKGYNQEVFGLFNGSLRSSANWAAGLPITYTGLTDGNWDLGRYMVGDTNNADNRLAIVRETSAASGNYEIVWWDKTSSAAAQGIQSTHIDKEECVVVTENSLNWVYIGGTGTDLFKVAYGSNTGADITFNTPVRVYADNTEIPFLIAENTVWTSDGAVEVDTNTLTQSDTTISFPDSSVAFSNTYKNFIRLQPGLVLSHYLSQATEDGKADFWQTDETNQGGIGWVNYGWNGSAWEKGNGNFKTTHLSTDPFFEGITIAFSNAAIPGNSFSANQFFTRVVCRGAIKHNAVTATVRHLFFAKTAIESTYSDTIPAVPPYTLTFPAFSDPDFIRILSLDKSAHSFLINGSSVAEFYFAGEVPGPNELTIDPITAQITFNATNAGESFVANPYVWVSQ